MHMHTQGWMHRQDRDNICVSAAHYYTSAVCTELVHKVAYKNTFAVKTL